MSIIGPLLMAGGTALSGLMSSRANRRATDASVDASNAGIAEQRRQFDIARGDMAPYQAAGRNALMDLQGMLGVAPNNPFMPGGGDRASFYDDANAATGRATDQFVGGANNALAAFRDTTGDLNRDADWRQGRITDTFAGRMRDAADGVFDRYNTISNRDFERDPGARFRQLQGERAINRAAAARGNVHSSGTMQALNEFNSGLASQEYANFDDRRARDMEMERARAMGQYGIDTGMAGSIYDARMGEMGDTYARGYGRAGDMLQGRTGRNANVYGARMDQIGGNYGRQMDNINALAGLAGTGQTAVTNTAGLGASMAANVGNLYGNIGDAQAGGAITGANIGNSMVDNAFGIMGAGANGMFDSSRWDWLTGMGRSPQATGRGAANALMTTVNGMPGMI